MMRTSDFMMVLLRGQVTCTVIRVWSYEFLTVLLELRPMLRDDTYITACCTEGCSSDDWWYQCM